MSLSISSVSVLPLPWGVPSLESHSPSSPFTHHEEKIQNMWCASLILQLPSAIATSELHVCCHLSSPDIWQCHLKETLYLRCDTPSWNEKILLLKYCWWHFWLMKGVYKSRNFMTQYPPVHLKTTHLLYGWCSWITCIVFLVVKSISGIPPLPLKMAMVVFPLQI